MKWTRSLRNITITNMSTTMSSKTKPDLWTYPRMTAPSKIPDPLAPNRPLLPLLPHPETTAPPAPPRPPLAPPPKGWTRSHHAAPAAYPKELREAHGTLRRGDEPYKTAEMRPDETKEEKQKRFTNDTNKSVEMRYAVHNWSIEEAKAAQPRGHWLAVERWKRDKPSGNGKVLVCTHANGLQKEVSWVGAGTESRPSRLPVYSGYTTITRTR